jgi:hypothetical protein
MGHPSFGVGREDPVDHEHVKVQMGIQTGAKAVDERLRCNTFVGQLGYTLMSPDGR